MKRSVLRDRRGLHYQSSNQGCDRAALCPLVSHLKGSQCCSRLCLHELLFSFDPWLRNLQADGIFVLEIPVQLCLMLPRCCRRRQLAAPPMHFTGACYSFLLLQVDVLLDYL